MHLDLVRHRSPLPRTVALSATLATVACSSAPPIPEVASRHLSATSDETVVSCPLPEALADDLERATILTRWQLDDGDSAPVAILGRDLFGVAHSGIQRAQVFVRGHGTLAVEWIGGEAGAVICTASQISPGIAIHGSVSGLAADLNGVVMSSCGERATVDLDGGFRIVMADSVPCTLSVAASDPSRHAVAHGPARTIEVHPSGVGDVTLHAPPTDSLRPVAGMQDGLEQSVEEFERVVGLAQPDLRRQLLAVSE